MGTVPTPGRFIGRPDPAAGRFDQGNSPMTDDTAVHVIDDDEAVRHSLMFLFESAGLPVRVYDSALAFLDVAGSLRSGCILTDVRMPELDGLALQRKLLDLGIRLPVIVMTGHGDVPIAIQALKAGAADFLEKPFDDEACWPPSAPRSRPAGARRA